MKVGFSASFAGLIPFALYLPLNLLLANVAGKHQEVVNELQTQRMEIANDGINYNACVKFLKAEPRMEAFMSDLRYKEEKHALWFFASNALNLSMQLSVATLMVWCHFCVEYTYKNNH